MQPFQIVCFHIVIHFEFLHIFSWLDGLVTSCLVPNNIPWSGCATQTVSFYEPSEGHLGSSIVLAVMNDAYYKYTLQLFLHRHKFSGL